MRKTLCFAMIAASVACGNSDDGSDDGAGFACGIGELSGTWRISYKEVDGDCGPIPAETVNLSSSGSGGGGACKTAVQDISSDKCRLDFDYTCPTTDGKGTQRWSGVTKQTAEDRLEADSTAQLQHPALGACRSTYKVTYTKLLAGLLRQLGGHRQVQDFRLDDCVRMT